jgi:beta-galactosidase
MKTTRQFVLSLITAMAVCSAARADAPDAPVRERIAFNDGWLFTRGDPGYTGESLRYERVRDWILPTGDDLLNLPPPRGTRMPRPVGNPGTQPSGNLGYQLPRYSLDYVRPDYKERQNAGWRKLTIPHDWGIEGLFDQALPGSNGKLPWAGVGWYRKHFEVPASDAGRRICLDVDGALAYSLVWINGELAGGWPYGYSSWRVDLTPYIKPGRKNTIAIRLDNPPESSRWYPGSGIYRNVWLVKTAPVSVAQWGVFVTTPEVSRESAVVNVAVTLDNKTAARAEAQVAVCIYEMDATGRAKNSPVAESAPQKIVILPGRQANHARTLTIASPKLWGLNGSTIASPGNRYIAETIVTDAAGKIIDRTGTPFGIRKIETTAARGFFLNGEHVRLNGVCMHHDLGALGAAINTRAIERQLEILQAMGCNAIRTSHNPPAPELLDLCDRMGFLVMDEAFDAWALGKRRDDYSRLFADWHEKDVRALVRRDRNHPSIIQWSIGNEVVEQFHDVDGWKTAAALAGIVRQEDRTRPVVAAFQSIKAGYDGFQDVVDVFGYNYKPGEYAKFHAAHPHIPIMGAETSSAISSRGEYFFPVSDDPAEGRADFQVSSYDLSAVPWGGIPETEWKSLDAHPYVLGEFVWTGFDYLGEPTPYNRDSTVLLNYTDPAGRARAEQQLKELGRIASPARSSYFGIVDLAGFPKDRYYLYQARWRPDFPMAHILPHWTWPGRAGQITPVHVYSNGDEVELFLNGKSLGRVKRDPVPDGKNHYRFRWDDVVYAPGELKAVAYKNGKPWAGAVMRTAGDAAKLTLTPDRAALRADGGDLSFVTVRVTDAEGVLVPRAKNKIKFTITGPAEIAAVDNGDATSFEPFQASERSAFNGLALVIVRTKKGKPGTITVKAAGEVLMPAEVILRSE